FSVVHLVEIMGSKGRLRVETKPLLRHFVEADGRAPLLDERSVPKARADASKGLGSRCTGRKATLLLPPRPLPPTDHERGVRCGPRRDDGAEATSPHAPVHRFPSNRASAKACSTESDSGERSTLSTRLQVSTRIRPPARRPLRSQPARDSNTTKGLPSSPSWMVVRYLDRFIGRVLQD